MKRSPGFRFPIIAILFVLSALSALSAPPDPPGNPAPSDGAADAPAATVLCVDVSDPQGESLDVTFMARETGLSPEEPFTIIFLPDTQYYSQSFPEIFMAQTRWIVENRKALNIAFVSHLGDIVQVAAVTSEWENAHAAMSLLEDPATTELPEGIPFGLSVGNHDQSPNNDAGTSADPGETTGNFNQYFGLPRFSTKSYYGGHNFANNDNNYQLFEASGMEFIIVHHEFDDTDMELTADVLTWTDSVLDTFADRRAILSSHSLLCTGTHCPEYLAAEFSTQGQAAYDALKHHANLFLMHCGHAALSDMQPRRSDNYAGNTIHTLLANYQRGEDCPLWCGNGFLRIMTFHPAEDRISVQTYSPWLDDYKTEPCFDGSNCQQFDLDYDMDGGNLFKAIGAVHGVTSGMTACLPWSGRQAGSGYEWYVKVANSTESSTSSRWTFDSNGQCGIVQDCDDQDACTTDACDAGTCSSVPIPNCCIADADCDDDNYCTDDACIVGQCSNDANTNACDDGDACTGTDVCSAGLCAGDPMTCDDGNACTVDTCVAGDCLNAYTPAPGCCLVDAHCTDGVRCTLDSCESGGDCLQTPDPGCCELDSECSDDGTICLTASCPSPNGRALSLDGVRDHVTVGQNQNLALPQFTVECWFNWDGGGTPAETSGWPLDHTDVGGIVAYPLVAKGNVDREDLTFRSVNYFLGIAESSHVLQADFEEHESGSAGTATNHPVSGTTPVTTGTWHHAAVTYDGICWGIYLDGQEDGASPNCPAEPAAFESAAYFAIGTSQNIIGAVLGRFSGAIDEVRIWSRALSADEIASGMNRQISSAPDLVAGWSFDTRNGFVTPESTGSGLDGVMVHGALVDAGVVDLGGHCLQEPTGECGIDGVVHYYRDSAAAGEPSTKPVPAVEIDVGPDSLVDATTDVNGAYTIPAVAGNLDLTTVDKFGSFRAADHNGAVTSFDASFIARHSIGQLTLSENQSIAADVSGNGRVTSFDAAKVVQFATEIIDHFDVAEDEGSDWKFLRCDTYIDESTLDCTDPYYSHAPIDQPQNDDFYALLYGDVTGNWASAASRSTAGPEQDAFTADRLRAASLRPAAASLQWNRPADEAVILSVHGLAGSLGKGGQRDVVFSVSDATGVEAFDLQVEYDPGLLRVAGIESTGFGSALELASHDTGGLLRLALYGALPLQGSGQLLTVRFEALQQARRGLQVDVSGEADEGQVPMRVQGVRSGARSGDSRRRPPRPR